MSSESTLSPTPRTSDPTHQHFIRLALAEAAKATPTPTAFCVGCVITAPTPLSTTPVPPDAAFAEQYIIATGFSRELEGNTHAEANALDKLAANLTTIASTGHAKGPLKPATLLPSASLYTTLEPCSVRTSGLTPCSSRILESGIKKVYMGVEEPTDFVVCEGVRILREAGVEVVVVVDDENKLGEECLKAARRGH